MEAFGDGSDGAEGFKAGGVVDGEAGYAADGAAVYDAGWWGLGED